jgi:hypothetical protein
MYLGAYVSGGGGSYSLKAGLLQLLGSETINGNFAQQGGANVISGAGSSLLLGSTDINSARGIYDLSGSGSLSAPVEYVGYGGIGNFIQSGGTNSPGALILAQGPGSYGYYYLNGGLLSVGSGGIIQGSGNAGFYIGGGTLAVGSSGGSGGLGGAGLFQGGPPPGYALGQVTLDGVLDDHGDILNASGMSGTERLTISPATASLLSAPAAARVRFRALSKTRSARSLW